MKRILASVSCMVLVVLCLGGCGESYGRYNIDVMWDEMGKDPGSIQVDFFAVEEEANVANLDIDKYFVPQSDTQQDVKKQFSVESSTLRDNSKDKKRVIDSSHWPMAWNNKHFLVVLANLNMSNSEDKSNSNRQVILPLNTKRWKDVNTITIHVRQKRIFPTPVPQAEKK